MSICQPHIKSVKNFVFQQDWLAEFVNKKNT